MIIIKTVFTSIIFLTLAACVTEPVGNSNGMHASDVAVVSAQDANNLIAKGSSFTWLAKAIKYYEDGRLKDVPVRKLLEDEILANLQSKGMNMVASEQSAQYSIAYTAALESSLDDYAIIREFGLLPGYMGTHDNDKEIEKGSLVILVFDNKSRELMWRSAAQAGVHFDLSMDDRRDRVKRVIAKMFITFPVAVK